MKQTVLHAVHAESGAKLVDFAGWDMPLHYGSQIEEHHAVRQHAGMFDVSHMVAVDLTGAQVTEFLRYLLANDIAKLSPHQALYSCMLNEQGGVLDDLIVYHRGDQGFRVVVNAGTAEKDVQWMRAQAADFSVDITPRSDLSIIAVQGPKARELVMSVLPSECVQSLADLKPFHFTEHHNFMAARTGYTGEDGFEIVLSSEQAVDFWQSLVDAGVRPCGLGARDTLRLEAGMNLYGTDMDETVTPLESGLAWTVAMKDDRQFIGRQALEAQKAAGVQRQLFGFVMTEKGVLRGHQSVNIAGVGSGEITSGTFSPTLGHAIALARIPVTQATTAEVEVRNKRLPVQRVKYPFVRHGQKTFELSE